ncbi:MAG: hypothetical protein ACKVP7_22280 [Hyphomicrobiaceae bacterium]
MPMPHDAERDHASRRVRLIAGWIALLAVIAGLCAHTWREALSLSPEAARSVAGGLGLMGILYAGVLFWWDRLAWRR